MPDNQATNCFIDTNIWLYAFIEADDTTKSGIARTLIQESEPESGLLIASQLRQRYSLSFWDSTIVATALNAGVPVLYSEDMQHGLTIEGRLQIRNPFL